jgi:general secretion pathway protein B
VSYILDALRRADNERVQGQVPGLHAQAQPVAAGGDTTWLARHGAVLALGLAALLTGGALIGVLLVRPVARTGAESTAPVGAPVPGRAPGPLAAEAPTPSPPPTPAAPLPVLVTAPAVAPAASVPAQARAAMPTAVPLSALSPEQRRELPPLAIGGWVWSVSAAQRFVVINGALLHEGEAAAAGVTLERIGPRSLTLRWSHGRVEVPL